MSEQLIQSQQVTLTGTVERVSLLLRVLDLDQNYWGVTVTIHTPSVTDATVGVTQDSQQNPRQREESMDDAKIKRMVDRFLGWKLPEDFNPDGGISFRRIWNEDKPWASKNEPTGTNLLDATQAEEMVRYMLADAQGSVTEQSQQNPRQGEKR